MVVPAPWRLRGRGHVLLLAPERAARRMPLSPPLDAVSGLFAGVGLLMLVDYCASPTGPYRELLYIPGYAEARLPSRSAAPDSPRKLRGHSIGEIFVTTEASRDSGIANWGIPKRLGRLAWQIAGDATETILLCDERGETLFEARVRPLRRIPALPMTSSLVPHTLLQSMGGRLFRTSIGARGTVRPAGSVRLASGDERFTALASRRVLFGFTVSRFRLEFPPADIYPTET